MHIYFSHLNIGGVEMQEHFVSTASVSLENFPYVLDLSYLYLNVAQRRVKVASQLFSSVTFLIYIKQ